MKYTIKTIGDLLTHAEYIGKKFTCSGNRSPYFYIVQSVFMTESGRIGFIASSMIGSQEIVSSYWKEDCDFVVTEITK